MAVVVLAALMVPLLAGETPAALAAHMAVVAAVDFIPLRVWLVALAA